MRSKKVLGLCSILLIVLFFQVIGYPFWDTLKSYGIMYLYDKYVQNNGYLEKQDILFYIPGGSLTPQKDWYPFILHHDASYSFSKYTKRNLSCMILYSFGSFDFFKGSSNLYNPNSSYQGAFYGGYAIFDHNRQNPPYGFYTNGNLNIKEIEAIPLFDQTRLVLPSIGCSQEKIKFESVITAMKNDIPYINREDWTRIDAMIKTNAPTHSYKDKNIGYIQYGKPHKKFNIDKDFPIISLKGRLYIKYIKEFNGTFIFYIMAKDQNILDETDKSILSHSIIKSK